MNTEEQIKSSILKVVGSGCQVVGGTRYGFGDSLVEDAAINVLLPLVMECQNITAKYRAVFDKMLENGELVRIGSWHRNQEWMLPGEQINAKWFESMVGRRSGETLYRLLNDSCIVDPSWKFVRRAIDSAVKQRLVFRYRGRYYNTENEAEEARAQWRLRNGRV